MKRFDAIVMFAVLWLLTSMVVDVLTPKDLTFYAIASALVPAATISGLLYWCRIPKRDFAVCFSILWMMSGMAIELISPIPLPSFMIIVSLLPILVVGIVVNFNYWRQSSGSRVEDLRKAIGLTERSSVGRSSNSET